MGMVTKTFVKHLRDRDPIWVTGISSSKVNSSRASRRLRAKGW
jgi:hypothetical protein